MVRVCSWRVRILFRANKPLLLASVVLNVFINGRFCEGGRAWRGEGGISPPYPFSHLTEENCLKEREGGRDGLLQDAEGGGVCEDLRRRCRILQRQEHVLMHVNIALEAKAHR